MAASCTLPPWGRLLGFADTTLGPPRFAFVPGDKDCWVLMHPVGHGAAVKQGPHYWGTLMPGPLFQISAVYFECGHHQRCPDGLRPVVCQLARIILGKFSPQTKLAAGFSEVATTKVSFVP